MPAVPFVPSSRVGRAGVVLACAAGLFGGTVIGVGNGAASAVVFPTPIPTMPAWEVPWVATPEPLRSSPPPSRHLLLPTPPPTVAATTPAVTTSPPPAPPPPPQVATEVVPEVVLLPPAPQAFDDAAETPAGQVVDIPVLADDTGVGPTVLSRTNPRHGLAVTLTPADGPTVVRYTPGPGFAGVDMFRYTLVDRFGRRARATVRVTVLAPPAQPGRAPRDDDEDATDAVASIARVETARASTARADGEALLWTILGSAVLGVGVLASVACRRGASRNAATGPTSRE